MANLNPVTDAEAPAKSGAASRLAKLLQTKFPQKKSAPQIQALMGALKKKRGKR